MQNLLIALMGDIYASVSETKIETWRKQQIMVNIENDCLVSRSERAKIAPYIHVLLRTSDYLSSNYIPVKEKAVVDNSSVHFQKKIKSEVRSIKNDVASTKTDVASTKNDVALIKSEVATKNDVALMKSEIASTKKDIALILELLKQK